LPSAAFSHDLTSRLDDLFAPYAKANAPGGAVAIACGGRSLYRRGFGLASVEHGIVNREMSRIPIGSITKQFTCAAILLLARDGVVQLNDPVARWITDARGAQREVTLRQLMMHTAGVRCYLDTWGFNGFRTMPSQYARSTQLAQTSTDYPPGAAASYSNGGYLLLSLVIERASGMPLERFFAQRLFVPAGMMSTSLPRAGNGVESDVSALYTHAGQGRSDEWHRSMPMSEDLLGEGGLISTPDDLLRWCRHLDSTGASPSRGDLNEDAVVEADGDSVYGFGVITERWRGLRVVQHAGALPGANSVLMRVSLTTGSISRCSSIETPRRSNSATT